MIAFTLQKDDVVLTNPWHERKGYKTTLATREGLVQDLQKQAFDSKLSYCLGLTNDIAAPTKIIKLNLNFNKFDKINITPKKNIASILHSLLNPHTQAKKVLHGLDTSNSNYTLLISTIETLCNHKFIFNSDLSRILARWHSIISDVVYDINTVYTVPLSPERLYIHKSKVIDYYLNKRQKEYTIPFDILLLQEELQRDKITIENLINYPILSKDIVQIIFVTPENKEIATPKELEQYLFEYGSQELRDIINGQY